MNTLEDNFEIDNTNSRIYPSHSRNSDLAYKALRHTEANQKSKLKVPKIMQHCLSSFRFIEISNKNR